MSVLSFLTCVCFTCILNTIRIETLIMFFNDLFFFFLCRRTRSQQRQIQIIGRWDGFDLCGIGWLLINAYLFGDRRLDRIRKNEPTTSRALFNKTKIMSSRISFIFGTRIYYEFRFIVFFFPLYLSFSVFLSIVKIFFFY